MFVFVFQTCSFGGRKVGHGGLVFNRKQDHLRCAMLAMVEKYLNPQSRYLIWPTDLNLHT